MSRVTYANTPDRADQGDARTAHGVRPVSAEEEGTGVNALPDGIYGYTYSPGLPNAPLFSTRRYRSYEIHKCAGEVFLVGFAGADAAREIASATSEAAIQVHSEPRPDADTLVKVPYSRIRRHRQYASPNEAGFSVMLGKVEEVETVEEVEKVSSGS